MWHTAISPKWFSGWWFQTFFMFHHVWENPSHWLSYFSEGLKPPTSFSYRENWGLIIECAGTNFGHKPESLISFLSKFWRDSCWTRPQPRHFAPRNGRSSNRASVPWLVNSNVSLDSGNLAAACEVFWDIRMTTVWVYCKGISWHVFFPKKLNNVWSMVFCPKPHQRETDWWLPFHDELSVQLAISKKQSYLKLKR